MNTNESKVAFCNYFNAIHTASKSIRTINPSDKELEEKAIKKAREVLSKAKVVYILGYGFDEYNNNLLSLKLKLAPIKRKHVMFTNYNDSNRINKKVSNLFFETSSSQSFIKNTVFGTPSESSFYYEKSVRDTYQALEMDFDSLEATE